MYSSTRFARNTIIAVAAFVTTLFALLGLAVDRADAATGVCNDNAGCITHLQHVNGVDPVTIFVQTDEATTVSASFHAAGSNVVKTQQQSSADPHNHSIELFGLKQHTTYLYDVTAKAWDSSTQTKGGVFTTGTRTVQAKVQRVKVDYDGDSLTDGEIRAGIRLGGDAVAKTIFPMQTIQDGHSVYPNKTFTNKDVPAKIDMLVTLWEDDESPGQLCTAGHDYYPTDSGWNSCADWTTAKQAVDVTKANDPAHPPVVVLAGDYNGLAFHAYVAVTVTITF